MSDQDREAVRAIRGGDREALARLVQRYQGRLFGLVLMMVRSPSAAEEVTQDAFVRAYMHIGSTTTRDPFIPGWPLSRSGSPRTGCIAARGRRGGRERRSMWRPSRCPTLPY